MTVPSRFSALLLFGSLVAGALGPALPAGAGDTGDTGASGGTGAPILVNCVGMNYQHFEPGLTHQTQRVILSGRDEATTCLSLTNPDRRSFVGPFSGATDLSCTSLFQDGEGSEKLHWNGSTKPADTSVWHYTISFQNVNGTNVGTATGPIVSGPLAGSTLTQTITTPQLDLLACSSPQGMTDNNGPSTWTFVKL